MLAYVNALLVVAMAVSAPAGAAPQEQRPYSCRLLDDEQKKCAFGSCDARATERLRKSAYAMVGVLEPSSSASM